MGKNISVYLNDELLNMVESSGKPASQVVQAALKKYFHPTNRKAAHQEVLKVASSIGRSDNFKEAIMEFELDREKDRW